MSPLKSACVTIVPFLIEDSKKMFYYRGLTEWDGEKGWLTDTCLDGQDTFKKLLATFEINPTERAENQMAFKNIFINEKLGD